MNTDKFYQIALTLVPDVSDVATKKLLAYYGSAELKGLVNAMVGNQYSKS